MNDETSVARAPVDAVVMREALLAAGWIERRFSEWISPNGELFRGPAVAYEIMKQGEINHANQSD